VHTILRINIISGKTTDNITLPYPS